MSKFRGYAGALAFVALMFAVRHFYGAFAQTRTVGVIVIAASLYAVFLPELPVSLGRIQLGRLKGWVKAFAIVPMAVAGICLILYAPQVSCIGDKAKRTDACRQFLSPPAAKP